MSPLTDVTNRAGHETLLETQYAVSRRRGRTRVSRSCPRIPCLQSQGESDVSQSHKSFKRKSEPVAIKPCNIQVSDQECTANTHSQGLNANGLCSNQRDPSDAPLPSQDTDILLSQAVQTLSLCQGSVKSTLQTDNHTGQHRKKLEKKSKAKSKMVASCSGLPETPNLCESGAAPQQCGACGLEFTSIPVLTQHLARHVFDGLYAAQWLTQAMQLVASGQPADAPYPHNDSNSINDDSQHSSGDS